MMKSLGLSIIGNQVSNLVSFILFALWCMFYSSMLTVQDLCNSFRPMFKLFCLILPSSWMPTCNPILPPPGPPHPACQVHDHGISCDDAQLVLEKLGLSQGPLKGSTLDIANMFGKNQEPDLGDVRAAFEVFDENRDGFIDARELNRVMDSLGLVGFSQHEIEKMIMAFDEDGDGKVDFGEFVKLMEDCEFE